MMGSIHYVSDTHFNHSNIIKFCNRPFSNVEEMNEGLVKNWNDVVRPGDTVWHLGDVTWGPFDLNRLNGKKYLIWGNHDKLSQLGPYFEEMYLYHELKGILPKQRAMILFHFPIESWKGKFHGSIHLHGHSHGTCDNTGLLRFDMGVDVFDMKPVPIESVLELVPKRQDEAANMTTVARDAKFAELNRVADADAIDGIDRTLTEMQSQVSWLTAINEVGGCTCGTKTPELAFHSENCRYRKSSELGTSIFEQIKTIRKTIGK